MGKVLLIEPKKILQQAISLALFPEHEVQVQEGMGSLGSGSLKDFDLLVLDGSALRELGQLNPDTVRAVQASKTPTVWLEEDEKHLPPRRANLLMVKKPIERESLHLAVAELLSPKVPAKKGSKSPADSGAEKKSSRSAAGRQMEEAPEQGSLQFIDLVDVVEEQTSSGQKKKSPGKQK